jgi:hypothetical protein
MGGNGLPSLKICKLATMGGNGLPSLKICNNVTLQEFMQDWGLQPPINSYCIYNPAKAID